MISCPNCQHQNPDGATQCEACYTPLPVGNVQSNLGSNCPNCGAEIETNATFCGQCGFNLIPTAVSEIEQESSIPATVSLSSAAQAELEAQHQPPTPVTSSSIPDPDPITLVENPVSQTPVATGSATRLQIQTASLFHVQTSTKIEIQQNLSVIHIGKPNEQIPPDIDVSGFPNSEIVSRIHADIRVEGDSFYIEDVGSSNGTYINHISLAKGNRHRLRPGDRIALGKGDLVSFIFQLS